MLDVSGELDGIFSTVGTRTAPSRGHGAAAVAAGRGMMQQLSGRVQTSQAPTGSNAPPLRGPNGSKARSFAGLQIPGSEAQSSASRRGSMDISGNVNRPYEDAAVEDESQPRAGLNGTPSTTKKRGASESVSRKSAGSSPPDGIVSPRTALASGPDGAAPAKRQRSSGLYPRNVTASPVIQQLEQHQKQVDLEQLSRGLQHNVAQGHSGARSRAQFLAMQRQQAYGQGTDRMNSAQFLSQLGTDNAMSRSGNRYASRANSIPNPPSFTPNDHTQSNRQREAYLQNQLSGGRRTPLGNANDRLGDAAKGATSRTPKTSDVNVTMSQASQAGGHGPVPGLPSGAVLLQMSPEGLTYLLNNEVQTLPMQQMLGMPGMPGNTPSLAGLGSNGPSSKKLSQNGQPDGNLGQNDGREQQAAVGSEAQQGDHKDDGGSLRMRQSYGRSALLKQPGTMQISEQEMNLSTEKKSKAEANTGTSSKQNGSRGELKRNGSNRAVKTIETTGGSRGRATPDSTNKSSALSGPALSLPQGGLTGSMVTAGTKRDRGAADGELENRSTKSDRPASGNRGGGTPSQKSTASGGSAAVEGRTQGTSSTGTRRGRGRSRGRGSGGSRRGRGDRAPPRGGSGSRGGNGAQAPRTTALEQKTAVSAALQRSAEATRASQADSERIMASSSMLLPLRGNSSNHESRAQSQKAERGGRGSSKQAEEAELQRPTKLSFDIDEDNTNNDSRGQDQGTDLQSSGSHLHNGGQLLEMLQQSTTGTGGRTNGDVGLDVDKAFNMQPLSLIAGSGAGKLGNQAGSNYAYDQLQYLTTGVEDADIGNMLHTMQDNLGLEGPTDFEDDNILAVDDHGDLTLSGRNRT